MIAADGKVKGDGRKVSALIPFFSWDAQKELFRIETSLIVKTINTDEVVDDKTNSTCH